MKRVPVDIPGPLLAPSRNLGLVLYSAVRRVAPRPMLRALSSLYQSFSKHISSEKSFLRRLGADLVFCPFTAPTFYDDLVPVVSVVYDLQHRYHPEFFDAAEVQQRERGFQDACRLGRCIVCTSRYVEKTILENASVVPKQIEIIPILLPARLRSISDAGNFVRSLRVEPDRFLLYPANFWPHKNHGRLLDAFRIYLQANPGAGLKLVLTGTPGPQRDFLMDVCRNDQVLSDAVIFTGYLSDGEFAATLSACRAVIFPSLFEGFGMPLVEGMAAGKPLLVSNTTSLPEVAGDAALYFDPTRPIEIAGAITSLESDPDLRRRLAHNGVKQLQALRGPDEMAARYLTVFRAVMS
jgi:glycosyltransferase involved in cell wall biosynthesis